MASLVLGAAGAAVGGAILPGSVSLLGATVGGATLGGALGAAAGQSIDAALFGRSYEGPRIDALRLQGSTEGAGIARVFGRMRVAGQVVWAARFREHAGKSDSGGKGGGPSLTEYSYTLSFAVALCEGDIVSLGRAWADGAPFDLGGATWRLYRGTEDQAPDALIQAIEGADAAPAFRGTAYIVFEDLDLTPFGNRLPNLSFEIYRRPAGLGGQRLESLIKGVTLIPGSGEFVYATGRVDRVLGPGRSESETHHNSRGVADIEAALDDLETQAPACEAVNLIVCWFGTDLRAGHCQIRPGVEELEKETRGGGWRVNGVDRFDAHRVSRVAGHPAYGGTPSDGAVLQAIAELKARGYRVTLTPFILMDVPPGNALPDPYGEAEQAAFPWRGRIAVNPAPGEPGSPDNSAAAAAQIDALFGGAAPGQFAASGEGVAYSGAEEWSLRRMVLHYALMAELAGGVDSFIIGTEMRGVTWTRSGPGVYPAVAHLKALAADVKSILPDSAVSYAADWSEYFGHQPADGSGDVYYHLDPLWADPNVDFVGLDWYAPLSDWREGTEHADAHLAHSPHDLAYLQSNVEGGEGYDWYYASPADRDAQIRTPITDGHGAPWVFRYKDLRAWWSQPHYDRPGGVPSAAPTEWIPESKPVRFMEVGCPAVDKGANQPNVFFDPKSSESALPYYSTGERDDLIQRRFLEAALAYWGGDTGNNPVSALYGGPMLDMENAFVWTWDARPYPDFPARRDVWSDGPNWRLGHWLTGRVALALLAEVVAELCAEAGLEAADVSMLDGVVAGYALAGPSSARDALAPLAAAYRFDCVESGGRVRFLPRNKASHGAVLNPDQAVWRNGEPRYAMARAQADDLPREARVRFVEEGRAYQAGLASARDRDAEHDRAIDIELPLCLSREAAAELARASLRDARAEMETLEIELPPSLMALEPGDAVPVSLGGTYRTLRLWSVSGGAARRAELAALTEGPPLLGGGEPGAQAPAARPGEPELWIMDLPLLPGEARREGALAAVFADPWPGSVSLWAGHDAASLTRRASARRPAMLGELLWGLWPGPVGRWDDGNRFRVRLYGGALSSQDRLAALAGGNMLAVEGPDGAWEILIAREVRLVEPDVYELSGLLRGLSGTEGAMAAPVSPGARVAVLDGAPVALPLQDFEAGVPLTFGAGPGRAQPGDWGFAMAERTWNAATLRPLSPVHLRGRREAGGVRISWTRRSRLGGDAWSAAEIPLGEEREAYALEILSGGEVALTLESASPEAFLTLAQEAAIFGGPVWQFDVRLVQVSPGYGRGAAAAQTLYLTP